MKPKIALVVLILISAGNLAAALPAEGFAEVADKVSPAVVTITVTKEISIKGLQFDNEDESLPDDLRKYFQFWDFDIPEPHDVPGTGSGFIFDARGYVMTNNHVITGASEITVKMSDGTEFTGKDVEIVGSDPETDIAVLKIKTNRDLPTISFADSDQVKVGDWAVAIGNPYELDYTLTVGVISGKGRSNVALYGGPSFQDFLQTDASINPGNSGGPLCNITGDVVGMNTAIRTNGLANSGIGFAIPSNLASAIAEELIENGKISRGFMGVYLGGAKEDVLKAMGIDERGVFVTKVIEDTPAEKAGFQDGDLIIVFAGENVTDVDQLRWLAANTRPGTRVSVKIIRSGKEKTLNLTLTERPEQEKTSIEIEKPEYIPQEFALGISARDISDKEKEAYGVSSGVYVENVKPASIAAKAGIMPGDVILKVNKNEVSDVKELKRLKGDLEKADILLIQINRKGHTYFLTIRP